MWVRLVGGKGWFGGANPAHRSVIDLAFTCHVQRALICGLDWKNKVQVDITMEA